MREHLIFLEYLEVTILYLPVVIKVLTLLLLVSFRARLGKTVFTFYRATLKSTSNKQKAVNTGVKSHCNM